jgi:hypothetical protein
MKIRYLLTALLLVSSLATPTMAQERTHTSVTRAQPNVIVGRQIALPPERCLHGPRPRSAASHGFMVAADRAYRNAFDAPSSATHDFHETGNHARSYQGSK